MKKADLKKIRFGVQFKFIATVMALGVILLTASILFVYREYKRNVFFEDANKLDMFSELIAERIESEFVNLANQLAFVAAHNKILIDSVANANASYAGTLEEENLKRFKSIDASWDKDEGERLRKQILNNPPSMILREVMATSNLPIAEIFVTDVLGAELAANQKTSDYYQADEDWWQRAFNHGKGAYYSSGLEYDESSHIYSFTIAVPIRNLSRDCIGVLKAVIDKEASLKRIFHIFLGRTGFVGVMSSKGGDIFHMSYGLKVDQGTLKELFDFMISQKGTPPAVISRTGGNDLILGSSQIRGKFLGGETIYIYCLQNASEAFPAVKKIMWKLSVLWLIVFFAMFIAISLISKRFVKPLATLKRGYDYLKKGLFDHKVEIATGDELEGLADDFNETIDALRKNIVLKDHFNQVIQYMSDILFVVDAYGVIDLINRRAYEILGYAEGELKGKEAIQIFSKKDRYLISWGLKGLIEEGALQDKKIGLLTKSGKEVDVFLGLRAMRDTENNLVGLVCLAKDLSQVDKLLGDLKKSNEETLRHKEELEVSLRQLIEARDVMLSILEDTDESKRALEETLRKLKETQDELLQAEKMVSLGQIAAGVAHEINNPLFVISGEAEIIKMEEGLAPSVTESAGIIREQAKRIEDIITRLLEFSQKKAARVDDVDIHELLKKTTELLRYQTKLLGHVDIVNKFSDEEFRVKGDENQLQEVFLNIAINGIQAMETAGGTLTIRTFSEIIHKKDIKPDHKFRPGDKIINIEISDTGIGMDEDTKKRIFEPFFTTKKTGVGLGLSVCFGIIESHGGAIEVESQPGKGATFKLKLPFKERL